MILSDEELESLRALAERLEKATGPDRELDLDLARALVPDVIVAKQYERGGPIEDFTYWKYSESLDAALSLVERTLPGSVWSVAKFRRQQGITYYAEVFNVDALSPHAADDHFKARAPTPALALCLALVRAKLAGETG